ncbi:MAG: helix-turn-helix domain-containing protein [Alphaproteobacteria bacterium]|nr:helix-turn-helix domain-containing protein [Alphaproteobacteria bacterium]MBU2380600.1 helix-turn-helix domain-containing protein [Alphaproteobacteria bacterium]
METPAETLDQEACYRAVLTRDARFDGRFFGCVKTTGIYCRPVCPARTPKRENMIFVVTAAAAEEAGFRACLRCRPETAPDMGAWRGTSNTVSRALSLIEAGALDEADVDALAARLGVGERQLRRLFRQHLGAAPVSVAQTRRVLLAKALLHETDLSMAQVALAAGFGSVRRFNETFQALYARAPSELRRRKERPASEGVRLSLTYRPPYDWDAMFAALNARGDRVEGRRWSRDLARDIDGAEGFVKATPGAAGRLDVCVEASDLKALPGVLARVRRVFDLSADPDAIGRDLSADPVLGPLVDARPGLRLPGDWIVPDQVRDDNVWDAPSDRLTDATLTTRAEQWRPWRAYGALHLRMAGLTATDLMEMNDGDARLWRAA